VSLTFEEGTSAAWLHDLLKPHVSRLVVCDPRKKSLLKDRNKSDVRALTKAVAHMTPATTRHRGSSPTEQPFCRPPIINATPTTR
jgi:hypothetical protein